MSSSPQWRAKLKLESGAHGNMGLFQSLMSVKRRSADDCQAKLAKRMQREIEEDDDVFGDDDDENAQIKKDFVTKQIGEMIECERCAWTLGYCTFYRVVDRKYVLYQFNTLMLTIFHDPTWGQVPHRSGLICTPSLEDSIYPESLERVFHMFQTNEIRSDSSTLASNTLLSVNNCLIPEKMKRVKSTLQHDVEASPMNFYTGYDETHTYQTEMKRFLQQFLELEEQEANDTLQAIFDLYKRHNNGHTFKGHCLQICIPSAAVERFAYPCVSWGKPVILFEEDRGERKRLHAVDMMTSSSSSIDKTQKKQRPIETEKNMMRRPVPLTELLQRSELGELQTRILAHPNLYLIAGAVTNVFHSDPAFDAGAFKRDLFALLETCIRRALDKGKRISLEKFRD